MPELQRQELEVAVLHAQEDGNLAQFLCKGVGFITSRNKEAKGLLSLCWEQRWNYRDRKEEKRKMLLTWSQKGTQGHVLGQKASFVS